MNTNSLSSLRSKMKGMRGMQGIDLGMLEVRKPHQFWPLDWECTASCNTHLIKMSISGQSRNLLASFDFPHATRWWGICDLTGRIWAVDITCRWLKKKTAESCLISSWFHLMNFVKVKAYIVPSSQKGGIHHPNAKPQMHQVNRMHDIHKS